MDLKTNLANAIKVLTKTYESVDKLMKFCDVKAEEHGYEVTTERFLRYKSDVNYSGWLVDTFIKCYQDRNDESLDNDFRNGPLYSINIGLKEGEIYIGKYVYDDMPNWSKGISPASYWVLDNPLCDDVKEFEIKEFNEEYMLSMPVNEEVANKNYWGLKYVIYRMVNLEDITGENAEQIVFATFEELKKISV